MKRTAIIVLAWATSLIIASSGTAIAVQQITSAQIRNRTITLQDLSYTTIRALRGQRGPAGPTGPQGAQGPQGAVGAVSATRAFSLPMSVDAGTAQSIFVPCPQDTILVGGGAGTPSFIGASDITVSQSSPATANGTTIPFAWDVTVRNTGASAKLVNAYAICAYA